MKKMTNRMQSAAIDRFRRQLAVSGHSWLTSVCLLVFAGVFASTSALAQAPAQAPAARPQLTRAAGRTPAVRPPAAPAPAPAEDKDPAEYGAPTPEELVFDGTNNPALKFEKAPYDILLKTYAEATGRTLLISPKVPKVDSITLRSQPDVMLTKEEYLQAIETVLGMNNIALDPTGDKFLRVLPGNELRTLGVKTYMEEPEGGAHKEDGRMVSQIIQLKNISIEEARKVVEGFKRGEGQIQLLERTNSILVTDTAENVNRMMEIVKYVDIPIENREETHVRPLKFAKAAEIKKRLEEVIAEALKDQQQQQNKTAVEAKQSGAPGFERRNIPSPPGVIRPGMRAAAQQEAAPKANEIIEALVSDAERGVIRGKVQIVADERTNILIFLTRPENMTFFDRIIDVLDVEVQSTPDVIVEVMRLEYAIAKDVAAMLNDLVGNASSSKDESQDAKTTVADKNSEGGSSSLADAANRTRKRETPAPENEKKSRLGELNKDNVKILADERSNSVIVMAAPADVASIRNIVASMDIQLSQVVIEAVIVSVDFTDSKETGMDWVQRAMLVSSKKGKDPSFSFATAGGGSGAIPPDTPSMTSGGAFNGIKSGGVKGWFTLFDLNMDLVLSAVESDSRARLMSAPRVTTMDNKEATIESTERIYWKEGSTHYTSSDYYSDNVKNEDIGTKIKVTPRINKNGYITLSISQEQEGNAGYEDVLQNGNSYPQLYTRKMEAEVAVQSGETVVLGGLAQNSLTRERTKVPILGSIPLIGWLFRYEKNKTIRTENIVFLTPRVIDVPADIEDDARKVKASIETEGIWDSSWSNSRLADPLPEKAAKKVLKNGEQTVAPARYPLTGHLTGLNDLSDTNAVPPDSAIEKAILETPEGKTPYIHFSDVEQEKGDGEAKRK